MAEITEIRWLVEKLSRDVVGARLLGATVQHPAVVQINGVKCSSVPQATAFLQDQFKFSGGVPIGD